METNSNNFFASVFPSTGPQTFITSRHNFYSLRPHGSIRKHFGGSIPFSSFFQMNPTHRWNRLNSIHLYGSPPGYHFEFPSRPAVNNPKNLQNFCHAKELCILGKNAANWMCKSGQVPFYSQSLTSTMHSRCHSCIKHIIQKNTFRYIILFKYQCLTKAVSLTLLHDFGDFLHLQPLGDSKNPNNPFKQKNPASCLFHFFSDLKSK